MPPKPEITREKILSAACSLLAQQGMEAVTARAVAQALGCSTQPIYSACGGMEELRAAAYAAALERAGQAMRAGHDPHYNAPLNLGLGYLRLAAEEKQLFRALFLSDWAGRMGSALMIGQEMLAAHAPDSSRLPYFSPEELRWLYERMTEYLTGLGALVSAGLLELSSAQAAARITEVYEILTESVLRKKGVNPYERNR